METTDAEPVAKIVGIDEPDNAGVNPQVVERTHGGPPEAHVAGPVDDGQGA